jgi:hypothetical protein
MWVRWEEKNNYKILLRKPLVIHLLGRPKLLRAETLRWMLVIYEIGKWVELFHITPIGSVC